MSRWDEYDRMQERVLEGRAKISKNNQNRHIPSQAELDEWHSVVANIKEQIRSGINSTSNWKINGKWVDVKGGRSFFLGDDYALIESASPEKQVETRNAQDTTTNANANSIIKPAHPKQDNCQPQKQTRTDKSLSDLFFTAPGTVFFAFIIISFIAYQFRDKSCAELISEAWNECNDDYNGKCSYLGPKYNPNCYPDEDDDYDSRREY